MICCKCGADKPQTEFYLKRTECKPCKKALSWGSKKRRMERDSSYREARNVEINEWKRLNPDKVRAWKGAWKKTPVGRISKALRRRQEKPVGRGVAKHCQGLLMLQRWRCAVCRADLKQGKHLDHVIPLAAGGRHEVGNFQWLCPSCNLAKSAKHPVEFMQSRGFLL
jgi:5-methylcytosine-specific restriction endonuclease McrA